jgi:putative Mn2+ efflux pump MntP
MNAIQWADSRSRALTVWDVGVLKLYCVMFGAVVGAYASAFVRQNVSWFVAGVLLLGGYFGYRWITAQPEGD